MKNKIVEQILFNRKQYRHLLENQDVFVKNYILILEKVSQTDVSINNFKKPQSFEEFIDSVKKYTGLNEIPEESLKQLKSQWENAKKQEALGIGSPGMAPNLNVGRDFDQQMTGLPKYSIPALDGKDLPSTITPDYMMDERQRQQKFLQREYPNLAKVDVFVNQAVDRIKKIATDPASLAIAVGGILLTIALPAAAIPLGVAAIGLGGYSAYQQASAGDYGGAAVDLALGAAGGVAGLRSIGKPATARGAYSASTRTSTKVPPPKPATETGMPESLKTPPSELPSTKFVDPTLWDYYNLTGPKKIDYKPSIEFETPVQFGTPSGWDVGFRGPSRPGTFGSRVRTPEGDSARVSRLPTKKERARIEQRGTPEEKAALARAEQKRLGQQLGGKVGERVATSDIPVVKQAIANYNKLAREIGLDVNTAPTAEQIKPYEKAAGFTPQRMQMAPGDPRPVWGKGIPVENTVVLPRKPSDYASVNEYIDAVSNSKGRELNQTEKTYLERAYAEDVRAQKMFQREPSSTMSSQSQAGNVISDVGPITKAVGVSGSVPGTVATATGSIKIPEIPSPSPYVAKAPTQTKVPYSFEPFIPSKTSRVSGPSTVSYGSEVPISSLPSPKAVIPIAAKQTQEEEIIFSPEIIKDLSPSNNPLVVQTATNQNIANISTVPPQLADAPIVPAIKPPPLAAGSVPKPKSALPGFKAPFVPVIPKDYDMGVSGKAKAIDVGTIMQKILGKYAGTQRIR